MNYATWESVEAFKNAFNNPEFREKVKHYPPSVTVSPFLFEKMKIPGICEPK